MSRVEQCIYNDPTESFGKIRSGYRLVNHKYRSQIIYDEVHEKPKQDNEQVQ